MTNDDGENDDGCKNEKSPFLAFLANVWKNKKKEQKFIFSRLPGKFREEE